MSKHESSRPPKGPFDLEIESLAFGGEAVGRHNGFVVFVKGAAPGELVRVRLTKSKKTHGHAEVLEILRPAPHRIEPVCPLFGTCGGCSWQYLPIEEQRHWKERIVKDSLRPLACRDEIQLEPLVASPDTFRYRNKMEFTFARDHEGRLVAGFHKPSNWREVLDVDHCWLAPESCERILRAAVAEGERQATSAWNPRIHEGTLRHLVLRTSVEEDAVIALLLTGTRDLAFDKFADALFAAEPRLKGFAWGLNDGMSDVARASEILGQRGELAFDERLGERLFRVSLSSFFQTNTRGAEKLYEVAREYLDLTGRERLLDAYCGTGTIGIFCGDRVRELYGIEIIQEAVWDARENAARNGLHNATFLAGDMRHALPTLVNSMPGRIDRLVVDPPRSGMEKKALEQLLNLRAPVMVYVSCNPTTMARDLQQMIDSGYKVEKIRPVDMFPQTYHVECVARCVLA